MLGARKGFYHHSGLPCKDPLHQSTNKCGHLPYDGKLPLVTDILQILGADHDVSAKGTSIGIEKFEPELKTLTLIMFSNLYPLSNTRFINLVRAQFLCDLIIGAPIDICAHIF